MGREKVSQFFYAWPRGDMTRAARWGDFNYDDILCVWGGVFKADVMSCTVGGLVWPQDVLLR